ncbi:MAG: hypothetical protein ACE5K4_02770 [Candidatus Hydrothermarchaeota archaeon]
MLITSSLNPSRKTRLLCRDLERAIWNATYLPRGKLKLEDIFLEGKKRKKKVICFIKEFGKRPGVLEFTDTEGNIILKIRIRDILFQKDIRKKPSRMIHHIKVLDASKNGSNKKLVEKLSSVFGKEGELKLLVDREKMGFVYKGKEIGPRLYIHSVDI